VEVGFGHNLSQGPKGLGADILFLIRLGEDIEGIVPFDVEGELTDRLFIGEIKHLLEDQKAHQAEEFFGGAAHPRGIIRDKLFHGEVGKDFFPEEMCPRL